MQYWIQPDTDTASINNLQREIGQITGTQIDYINSPSGFMFYIKEIENNEKVKEAYFVHFFLKDKLRI